MNAESSAYRDAGVDIDAKYSAVIGSQAAIRSTYTPGVVGDVGMFGGLFDPGAVGAAGQLLVASTDGVGTKVMVARMAGDLTTVGQDLVNHCVNDILVQGARPLFFMDYLAMGRMEPDRVRQVLEGVAKACVENRCALLGGETAEMPGVYVEGELDIAGTILGAVPREKLLDGTRIRAGDQLIGLVSSGLHTNGYSLARKILFADGGLQVGDRPDELGGATVGEALLAVHRSYLHPVSALLDKDLVTGMAHITGGGLRDNLPRVLPAGLGARIDRREVPKLPVFSLLVGRGGIADQEAWRVFNMGVGMVLAVRTEHREQAVAVLRERGEEPFPLGSITAGDREVHLL